MSKVYQTILLSLLALSGLTKTSSAQNAKVKTVTIINGDTTISESNTDRKEFADIDKEISVIINDDGGTSKKIVKKIIINNGGNDGEGMAYAYSTGDDSDAKTEISEDENGNKTETIIKNNDKADSKGEKKVIRKSVKTSDAESKENLNMHINLKGTNAKVDIETGSKEPLNVVVLDENGKQVFYDSQKTGGKYSKEIKLEKKGTYFLNLIQNKTSTTEKIIVE
jgi:hypothetical protein